MGLPEVQEDAQAKRKKIESDFTAQTMVGGEGLEPTATSV